ncbi:DUF1778 domain-containing protein [Rhizobium leguminosarum]|uniref:type II toxin -antitoxin system TacA 1-like antitoxin n=1 Tax=Rhizobium leguminosarum TaxID=384 RepID=UPI001C9862BD|nr:DUF1778 domain-containing protein [Rhizobium leguminosarum]MBY5661508.1 DUF1778 domain-containing protein [Rhizobium leguminosarum]MBY5676071.1 DUF1778 domain-containing protein [Rhizobium leguminosarum]
MPRVAIEGNERMSLRIAASAKVKLVRAAALSNIINEAEVIKASERDYGRILGLLESSPLPNEKLLAAAGALP